MAMFQGLMSRENSELAKVRLSFWLVMLAFGYVQTGYSSTTASQQLLITVASVAELSVKDPILEAVFDPLLSEGNTQEVALSSAYMLKNTIRSSQMITANLSELIEGIDVFVTLGIPASHGEGATTVPDVQLSLLAHTAVSGIMPCIGEGSIDYRVVADFSKLSKLTISQKVLTVTYTLTTSGPSVS